ncbi:MAG: ATP-binding protein [Cyanobacteria bacterium P01_D01_bin.128]
MTQSAYPRTQTNGPASTASDDQLLTQPTEQSLPITEPPGKLVLIHSATGEVSLMQWPGAVSSGAVLPGYTPKINTIISEAEFALYWQKVQQVLSSGQKLAFAASLRWGDLAFPFNLEIYPLPGPNGSPEQVMLVGTIKDAAAKKEALRESIASDIEHGDSRAAPSDSYCLNQLTQITWNIRRTLDLETIWQQTVNGLGTMLSVHRVLIGAYMEESENIDIKAEYDKTHDAVQGSQRVRHRSQLPGVDEAIAVLQPVIHQLPQTKETILAIATCYQDMPNGVIVIYSGQPSPWTTAQVEAISELADQVGTAIAHATLFSESQSLAIELQRVNDSLMQKHRELEDARRQAEDARSQAEEASRLKSEFLANTSHELRTPLNGMIGFLRLVLDGMADDPDEQEDFIREAHQSALHLLNLINDVLDIAKIEAGKMQIDMGTVELEELFSNVENFTRPQAEQKGLAYEISMPPTRDNILLQGNYQRLLQVMLNLIGNAIKFTHEGSVTVNAEVKHQKVTFQGKEWPGMVKIKVADTGIGVSLEKQDRLFQTFSQVDGERTRQYGGTGLGLAISQKLVEAMGGVVQFISMGEGLGSTVTFTALLYQEPVLISAEHNVPTLDGLA